MFHFTRAAMVSLLLTAFPASASALLEEKVGPQPKEFVQQSWPTGIAPLLRDPTRVYSVWVNGNNDFFFDADDDALKRLIGHYAKMNLRDHVVHVRPGQPVVTSFKKVEYRYNVHLKLLEGIALWHARSQTDDAKTFEPELTIFVHDEQQQALLQSFDWPEHLIVDNEVPQLNLPTGRKPPTRKVMHTAVQWTDGRPAVDFEGGVTTKITLWKEGQTEAFRLGDVLHDGTFKVALSKDELQQLNDGQLWLTMTVGNFVTQPKADHPQLPVENFRLRPENVKPIRIPQPAWHYGQLLFDDGKPPVMDPPGSMIRISFPYAGQVEPDKDGRFRIFLTEDQLRELKQRKARKNIYVPLPGQPNRSRAMYVFPVEGLATEPDKVQPVKIPRS